MEVKRFIFEFKHVPDAWELNALLELAGKLNATIRQESTKSAEEGWQPLNLKTSKRPDNINAFAIQEKDISPLIELFSAEELSAEELCNLLD